MSKASRAVPGSAPGGFERAKSLRRWRLGVATLALALTLVPRLRAQSELDRAPSRFAMAGGLRIHFKSFGTGRTGVVFVHGWLSDLSAWRHQVEALSDRARILVLDLPGFGRSSKPDGPYSIEGFASAVLAVMDVAGVEQAVLVGHSMGTSVVRQVYRLHPDRVVGLVAVDGTLQPPPLDSASVVKALAPFEGADYRTAVERMIGGMYPDDLQAGIRRALLGPALATPQGVALATLRAMYDPRIWGPDPIGVPLLVVVAKGPRWPPAYRAFVERLAPGARYEELDEVSHFLMLESPDAFNPILTSFLASVGVLRS